MPGGVIPGIVGGWSLLRESETLHERRPTSGAVDGSPGLPPLWGLCWRAVRGLARPRPVPRDDPVDALSGDVRPFYDGEYRDALDSFNREGRGAIKNVQSRWIDSICYHAMSRRVLLPDGPVARGLDNYTAGDPAVRRVFGLDDPGEVSAGDPAGPRSRTSAIASPGDRRKRQAQCRGSFPRSMLIGQGRLDNSQPFRQGGIVERPILFGIDVVEIVRCTSLAIRRRTELLGAGVSATTA